MSLLVCRMMLLNPPKKYYATVLILNKRKGQWNQAKEVQTGGKMVGDAEHRPLAIHCTMTVRFIPGCIVQYNSNLPAVLNGPIVALSPPLKVRSTVGAPGSVFSTALPFTHEPFLMICSTETSSTSAREDPFVMVTEGVVKLALPICAAGPEAALSSRMAQAASVVVRIAKRRSPTNTFLYITVPFNG